MPAFSSLLRRLAIDIGPLAFFDLVPLLMLALIPQLIRYEAKARAPD